MSNLNTIKICSWNIRGLRKPAKRLAIMSYLKKENVSIAFLQETHLEDKEVIKLQKGWVGQVFAASYSSSGRGVIILVSKKLPFRCLTCVKDNQGRYVIVKGVLSGKNITLMNFYCPPGYPPDFLTRAFAAFSELSSDDCFVGGDFNCHFNPMLDKLPPGTSPPSGQARVLNSICQDIGYSDVWRELHPTKLEFTFFSAPHKSYTRIDYFFIPSSKMFLVQSCTIGSIILSDHAPLYLVYSLSEDRVLSRRWRFQTSLLRNEKFTSYFAAEFRIFYSINSVSTDNPSVLWETCKAFSRGLIISFTTSKRRQKNEQCRRLESRLAELEKLHISTPSPNLLKELTATRTALNTLLIQDSEHSLKFARQRLYEFGDKPGKFLANLARNRSDSQTIVSITNDNGVRSFDTKSINKEFELFYSTLYKSEQPDDALALMQFFFSNLDLPQVTEDQKLQLNAPITKEEALLALKSMPSGKAPGPDGFGCEFYKEFSSILLDPLLAMFNHSFESGILPQSLREANISLILKKGKCPDSCTSYRPIALLNADQKLLSKILAMRLEKVLPHIIKEDQTGFIKGRHSYNNIRRLLNVIQVSQSSKDPALVLSLDAEKAFDRVEWSYLHYALEQFGMAGSFANWVKILYNSPTAAVITNGLRSSNFPLHRGNRQGDPLSPLLFDIAIEPLAQAVRQSSLISGILVGGREHKITLYADDVLMFLSRPETSIPCLTKLISSFGAFSGYKINLGKSEAMPLGMTRTVPIMTEPFPFRWSPSGFIYLGVYITHTFEQMYKFNFPPLLDTIKADLDRWAPLPLSWLGRVALIKMNVLPRLLYPLQMIPILLSNKVIKVLEGWLSAFIWSKRKPRLKMTKLQMAGSDGGLDVPNVRLYQLAAHLRVIADWLKQDPASIWLDVESSQSKCPLFNLLFVNNPDVIRKLCLNPITLSTVKAWRSVRIIEGRVRLTSPLAPILGGPDFLPGSLDQGFRTWYTHGLARLGDLFAGQTLLSFQQIQQRYGLHKNEFFRYLQIRHFVVKDTTLTTNSAASSVESALSSQISRKHITIFYKALISNLPPISQPTKEAWERDLGVSIDDATWREVWAHAMDISVCNRAKSIQFRIIHRVHITPVLKNKLDSNSSSLCWKCNTGTGDYVHCFWSCAKLQRYWLDITNELSVIFGKVILLDPMCLLLGLPDAHITNSKHKRLFKLLTFAARKNILLFWSKDATPTKKSWHNLIMDCIPNEYITCMLHSTVDTFHKVWEPYLKYIGPTLSLPILLGFPKLA